MLVQVSQREIDAGDRGLCATCPIALGVSRLCRPGIKVSVSIGICLRGSAGQVATLPVPEAAWEAMRLWDMTGVMRPFSFHTGAMPEWAKRVDATVVLGGS